MKRVLQMLFYLAVTISSGSVMATGCANEGLIWPSIRDGLFTYVSGSINNDLDTALFGDFIINTLMGDSNNSLL